MTSIRPPSRFNNYADSLTNQRSYSTVATMDLDESLRALYFAPVPLIVLDATRTIKMLNKPAESVIGLSDVTSIGQKLDRYVAPTSRQHFHVAMNEAVQQAGTSSFSMANPYPTRVALQSAEDKSSVQVDVSITAWFATDPIFSMTPAHASVSAEASPASHMSPSSPMDHSARSSGTSNSNPVHEAYYTIYIVPAGRSTARRNSPSSTRTAVVEQLKNEVLENIDVPMMTVSRDTKVVVQNEACRQALRVLTGGTGGDLVPAPRKEEEWTEQMEMDQLEQDADFSWIAEAMVCYDEKFERVLEQSDWPIYKCAVLGQTAPPIVMGIIVKANNERLIFEISGKPMRSRGGYGEHIGGVVTYRNITAERLKIRQEVRTEGDLYFRQTCDAMPQLVWVASSSGYVEWYSKSWYDYTGTSELDSRGVGWQQSIHEEDFPEAAKRWSYSLRTGELYETAYRVQRYDGCYRWFLGRALPMRDPDSGKTQKWFGTCTDIDDQVEALANSRRAQSQLENVINHAAMTIWATDREGRITVAEGPGVRQLKLMLPGTPGSSSERGPQQRQHDDASESGNGSGSNVNSAHSQARQHMIGRSIYSIWDPALIGKSMEKALSGEVVVEEMEIEGRWFRTSYTPMRAQSSGLTDLIDNVRDTAEEGDGEIIGVVGASLDITDRKRAQERVEESLIEKTRALAAEGAAREASRLKSEFLANMSHEIRTPIAGVIGLSELLLDEKGLTAQQRDYAETIQRSAEGLLTVINDVLDFSKVEIGKLDVEKAPFNLEVLLRDAKRMLTFATQKKGLEFREAVGLTYKGQVLGDMGRLRQVITNLLTNAIKFTAEGFISLEVTETSETADDLVVKFDVRDSGCGINPITLSRLFQPFSQADPSTARRFGGTGLGLSISKNLVELMKGSIGLDSVEGNGSHAWFIIPFRKAPAQLPIPASSSGNIEMLPAPAAPAPANGFGMGTSEAERATLIRPRKDIWILIAEDNVVNAQIASKNIKRMGFNCRTADNGLRALEELERHTYDAILMDCQMPECDGYEATRLIRSSPNPDIRMLPIIALTASAIKGDRERALEAGMVDYLAKPVKRPALEATLCRWLYDGDARQSLSQYMEPADVNAPFNAGTTTSASFEAFGHLLQDMRGPLQTASSLSSAGAGAAAEFPFPDLGSNGGTPRSVTFAAGLGGEVMSPATTQRLADVQLSPTSEAVIGRLKSPDEPLSAETMSLLRSGDTLSAAAVLLNARRASAEEVDRLRRDAQRDERPSSSPRSFSYHGRTPVNSGAHVTFAEPSSAQSQQVLHAADRAAAASGAHVGRADAFPLFRRSSREQAGLGRDLDAEMMRAAMTDQPALHEAMESGEDVTMEGVKDGR